eukprot:403359840
MSFIEQQQPNKPNFQLPIQGGLINPNLQKQFQEDNQKRPTLNQQQKRQSSAQLRQAQAQANAQKDQQNMTKITAKGGIRNKKVVALLEKQVYPDVRQALSQFISLIHQNGELETYWSQIEKKNSSARRAAVKLEKMKRKLEMGSDYDEDSGNEGPNNRISPVKSSKVGGRQSSPGRSHHNIERYHSTHEDHEEGNGVGEDESMDDFDSDEDLSEDENQSPSNDNYGDDGEKSSFEIFNPFLEYADILRMVKAQRELQQKQQINQLNV